MYLIFIKYKYLINISIIIKISINLIKNQFNDFHRKKYQYNLLRTVETILQFNQCFAQ